MKIYKEQIFKFTVDFYTIRIWMEYSESNTWEALNHDLKLIICDGDFKGGMNQIAEEVIKWHGVNAVEVGVGEVHDKSYTGIVWYKNWP